MQGAREIFGCPCPPPYTALGRRQAAITKRRAARAKAGKRADWNRRISTPEMAHKAAEGGVVRGLRPSSALREAGYPPSTCSNGKLNKMIRGELAKMGKKYIKIGQDLTAEDQENMVRGRLAENVILGTDKGVMSAKQLGADKRIAMWQPDSQVGMVVINAPEVLSVTVGSSQGDAVYQPPNAAATIYFQRVNGQ